MKKNNRWVILEHTEAPIINNPKIHFDLLLEDRSKCRAWRLNNLPKTNGPQVKAIPGPIHRLAWLEIKEAEVSNGRGHARQILSGFFDGNLPLNPHLAIEVKLIEGDLKGTLRISNMNCVLTSH